MCCLTWPCCLKSQPTWFGIFAFKVISDDFALSFGLYCSECSICKRNPICMYIHFLSLDLLHVSAVYVDVKQYLGMFIVVYVDRCKAILHCPFGGKKIKNHQPFAYAAGLKQRGGQ